MKISECSLLILDRMASGDELWVVERAPSSKLKSKIFNGRLLRSGEPLARWSAIADLWTSHLDPLRGLGMIEPTNECREADVRYAMTLVGQAYQRQKAQEQAEWEESLAAQTEEWNARRRMFTKGPALNLIAPEGDSAR